MSQNNNLFQPYTQGQWGVLWQILRGFLPTRRRSVASRWGGKNPLTKFATEPPLSLCVSHMVRNKLHWDPNDAVGLSKQREVGLDW